MSTIVCFSLCTNSTFSKITNRDPRPSPNTILLCVVPLENPTTKIRNWNLC